MKLSTRSRYGIRLMLALAKNYGNGRMYLKDVAKEEELSEKYLSQLVIPLKSANLIKASRGAHGGYMLDRAPDQINVKDIVALLEGSLCLVECSNNPEICSRYDKCNTRDLWENIRESISNMLENISLQDLLDKKHKTVITYQI